MNSNNYFTNVNKKPTLKSQEVFTNEGSKPELLLEYYDSQRHPIESNFDEVDEMFKKWIFTLFNGFNLAIHGPLSKYRLLETFKARYLDSDQIPDYQCTAPDNGSSVLNITSVKCHGFVPIKMERFIHGMFGINVGSKAKDTDLDLFLKTARKTRTHYVFLMHSFDQLYRNSRPVVDLIFELFRLEPKYMHIILSTDHIHFGKVLHKIKFQLQLIFYTVNYGESYFKETTQSVSVMNDGQESEVGGDNLGGIRLFEGQVDLESLKDVYQAIQQHCQKIMVYIFQQFVQRTQEAKDDDNEAADRWGGNSPSEAEGGRKKSRKSLRSSVRNKQQSTDIDFNDLLSYCERNFIVRRSNMLRDHLGELVDHKIVSFDETGNKIQCLVSLSTCKKFLEQVEDLAEGQKTAIN